MRYAIVSDLHANMQAWKAVLLDIRSSRIDHIISLGDLVGYGPSPAELLQSVHANIHSFVMGNHDAVICGKLGDDFFSDQARETLLWTRRQLGKPAIEFLSTFPLMLDGGSFLCSHANFTKPESFDYILGPDDAADAWQSVSHQLLFAGHTHEPALYLLGPSHIPRLVAPQDFVLEPAKRYLVNVGSVGCPRDRDSRASYCIFDTGTNAVYWRRIPYDLDVFRRDYERVGRDPETSIVLRHDPRIGSTPLRDRLDFSPPKTAEQAASGVVDVLAIRTLQRHNRRWKMATALSISLLTLAGAAGGYWWQQTLPRPASIRGEPITPIQTLAGSESQNLIPHLIPAASPTQPPPGWTWIVGDSRRQTISMTSDSSSVPTFVLSSDDSDQEMVILPPPVDVTAGMSFYPDIHFAKSSNFLGTASITVSLTKTTDGAPQIIQQFYTQEPGTPRGDGWARARRKFEIPSKGSRIQLKIGGRFSGTVRIRNITLGYSAK